MDEITLPTTKVKAKRVNPSSMVLFGHEKTGKTTMVSGLEDCLTIDLQKGTHFLDIVAYDVITEAEKQDKAPIVILKKLINKIKEANKKKGDFVYKRIVIDTASDLENIVMPLAAKLYSNTPMGKNWTGDNVLELPRGAGYVFQRNAFKMVKSELEQLCDTLIIIGHIKDSSINLNGEEVTERNLKLTGALSAIVCSDVDAVGYVYRKENKTIINFKPSESLIVNSRAKHLANKEITIVESDEEGNLTIDWSKVFID